MRTCDVKDGSAREDDAGTLVPLALDVSVDTVFGLDDAATTDVNSFFCAADAIAGRPVPETGTVEVLDGCCCSRAALDAATGCAAASVRAVGIGAVLASVDSDRAVSFVNVVICLWRGAAASFSATAASLLTELAFWTLAASTTLFVSIASFCAIGCCASPFSLRSSCAPARDSLLPPGEVGVALATPRGTMI